MCFLFLYTSSKQHIDIPFIFPSFTLKQGASEHKFKTPEQQLKPHIMTQSFYQIQGKIKTLSY